MSENFHYIKTSNQPNQPASPTLKCTFKKCENSKFENEQALNMHLKLHHTENVVVKSIKCTQCSSSFQYKSQLKVHVRKAHKTYYCEHENCDGSKIGFEKWTLLLKHRSEVHPHVCEKCPGKLFKTSQGLKKHIDRKHFGNSSLHQDDSQFYALKHTHLCSKCGQRFKRPSDLLLHTNTKHKLMRFYCFVENCKSSYQSKVFILHVLDKYC